MSWSRKSRAVALVALLMGMATGVAGAQEEAITGPENRALLDEEATEEMIDTAESISTDLFSYEYTELTAHRQRFNDLTTDDLADRYDELFGQLADVAEQQKISMESEVVDVAVRVLRDDEAQVLVFLDQDVTRGDSNQSTSAQTVFLARFTKEDGGWKAADIETFEDK